ncbi:hypothetical protein ACFLY4_01910 [Chloroflexota bacterium]
MKTRSSKGQQIFDVKDIILFVPYRPPQHFSRAPEFPLDPSHLAREDCQWSDW